MCKICISPYNDELKRAWNAGFPRRMLWEKYNGLIWGKKGTTFPSFQIMVMKHWKHKDMGVVVFQTTGGSVKKDLAGIANMVNDLFSRKLENMSPEDITVKEFSAANKLVLDEKKLKLDEKEQMMELAKLFGIPEVINPLDVIKGEEADAQPRPQEITGDKQISS